jgi:hypothetical protein
MLTFRSADPPGQCFLEGLAVQRREKYDKWNKTLTVGSFDEASRFSLRGSSIWLSYE